MDPLPNPPENPVTPQEPAHQPGQVFGPAQIDEPTAPQPSPPPTETPPAMPALDAPAATGETYTPGTVSPQLISANEAAIHNPPKRRIPKLLLPAAAAFVLMGGAALAYFGYYSPNKPENLWKTSLTRTGKGYDKLVDYANTLGKTKTAGISIDGSFKISGSVAADGTFKGSSSNGNGQFSGSLSASGLKVNLDTRFIKSANSTPDVYLKVDGLQGLGKLFGGVDSSFTQALEGVNNQWYLVDHSLFDQYAQGANSNLQLGSSDFNALLKAVDGPTKKYVFTDNDQNMALTVKQQVGKEKQDGRNTYHYKVGVNKDKLKAYDKELCDSLKDTKIFKLISAGDVAGTLNSCKDTSDIDNIKDSDTADVWVDTRTKLIHKVRFSYKDSGSGYTDIGQDYQGGDKIPFFIVTHSKSAGATTDGRVDLTLDTKANSLDIKGKFDSGGADKTAASFDFGLKPDNSALKVQKPDGAKNIIQLLDDLGIPDIFNGIQSSAKDTERKTDINALAGQIEAYQANNGYYPTLANLNDLKWRAANLKGLDTEALKDPAGKAAILSAKPAAGSYSYEVKPANCDNTTRGNCTDYTLTATLDTGGTYVKQALNFDNTPQSVLN